MERRHLGSLGGRDRHVAGLRRRRPRIERLEERQLLASITEFPLLTAGAQPQGIVTGPDGNLWFTETNADKIGRITPAGLVTEFPIPTANAQPVGISRGPAADLTFLWFTESAGNNIGRIDTATGAVTEFPILTTSASPQGITAGPDGNLWFTESGGNNIGQITPAGVVTEFPVTTAGAQPQGITAGPDGNLWFTEANADNIGQITLAGLVTEFPVPTANALPQGITAGKDGNLYFTEAGANSIGQINPSSHTFTEFPITTPTSNPIGITTGPAGDANLYFTESAANRIGRLNPTTGSISEFPIPTSGAGPNGITAGPDGRIWFTEANVDRIGRFDQTQIIVGTAVAPPITVAAGATFTGTVATFTAAGLNLPAGSYSATINWGDGTTTPATSIVADPAISGVFDVIGSHRYATAGTFPIIVTIRNTAGDTAMVTEFATVTSGVPAAGNPPSVVSLQRFGIHNQPTIIVLGFSVPLDPISAQNPFNYTIVGLGPFGQLDTGAQIAAGQATNTYEHVTSATYNPFRRTVTLTVFEHLDVHQQYLLVVNGRPAHPTASGESPNGVASATGVLLDGNFNGLAGSDYVVGLPAVGQPLAVPGTVLPPGPFLQATLRHVVVAHPVTRHVQTHAHVATIAGPLVHSHRRR